MPHGVAGAFIAEHNTAPAQIPGAKISVCHGGCMFAASGTIMITMANEAP